MVLIKYVILHLKGELYGQQHAMHVCDTVRQAVRRQLKLRKTDD